MSVAETLFRLISVAEVLFRLMSVVGADSVVYSCLSADKFPLSTLHAVEARSPSDLAESFSDVLRAGEDAVIAFLGAADLLGEEKGCAHRGQ